MNGWSDERMLVELNRGSWDMPLCEEAVEGGIEDEPRG